MSEDLHQNEFLDAAVEFHLLGRVDFDDCVALQRRLADAALERDDGRIDVLICEHPNMISVGRNGSRAHIRLANDELRRRQWPVRWVGRGGGCVFHAPGQLAVYSIAPLAWHGWTVGQYVQRLQAAVVATIEGLNVHTETHPPAFGVWGRTGLLAAFGVSVRNWVTCHGVFLNVNPSMSGFGFVDAVSPHAAAGAKTTMGSLLGERRQGIRITSVRAALIENLARAFDCRRYHLHTGHPLLPKRENPTCEPTARAS